MRDASGLSRRFVIAGGAAAAGGLAVGFTVPDPLPHAAAQGGDAAAAEINAWVLVRPDDTVVVRVARSELGQGTLTGLAQLVAEELDCNWAKVTAELVQPADSLKRNRIWRDFVTTSSRGVRGSQDYMRQGGAAARLMLLAAAADIWKVLQHELVTEAGVVKHPQSGRALGYGKLAAHAAKVAPPDVRQLKLKDPGEWVIAGQPLKRLDQADKLNGRAVFGVDVKLPGMLCAAIRDAPVVGAKVGRMDAPVVVGMPGVRHVLQVGESAVAVVAETWWQASKALAALPVDWAESADQKVNSQSIQEYLAGGLDTKQAVIGHTHGDALKGIAGSVKKLEAVYGLPYVHHATLEPMACTALWKPDAVEVWVPTQSAESALRAAAEAAGLPPEKAVLHRTHVGGSFGRRSRHDHITQAVTIAKQVPGTPIKLIWSREEDTSNGFYRPIGQCKLVGGIDDKGEVQGLIVRISGQSILGSLNPRAEQAGKDVRMFQGLYAEAGEAQIGYSIPNLYIDHAMRNTHVPVGSWRGVYTNQNAVYLECFIDELARAAERDPFEFRRQMMRSHPKHLAVLTAAAEKAGWEAPPPEGVHRGIAQIMAFGSYTAAVVEVSVSVEGRLKVHRVVLALDCGTVVNPDLVAAQVEGSVAFGLSSALGEEITIRDGRVVQQNFDSYEVLRLAAMPIVETVLVPSGEFFGGVGEACVAVVAPALLNAVFDASGKRVRTLPLKHVKLV